MEIQQIEKPSGYEGLIAHSEAYAGKILCIRAGHRLSLQHHTSKDETLFLLQGDVELEWDADHLDRRRQRMCSDESYRVRAGRRHRLIALCESRVLEISTP
jgi:mannose-6-phosphate isomerase